MSDPTNPGPGRPQYQYGTPQQQPSYGRAPSSYGAPVGPPAWTPQQQPAVPPPARRRPVVPIVAGVAALALVGAGVVFLPRLLGGAAAGAQPSVVVPASAVAYMSVDLNPTLGQKAGAAQFLNKFPAFRGQLTDASDLRKVVFEQLQASEPGLFTEFDYDADVKPWLGDRFAVAAVPGAGERAVAAVVLAVTDEAKAAAALDRLAPSSSDTECAVADRFAVCGERGTLAQATASDQAHSLDAQPTFTGDLAAVGGDAIGTVWADVGAAARLVPEGSGVPDASAVTGRLAGKLRFDGATALEFAGVTRGASGAAEAGVAPGTAIGALGADTVVAVSVNGLGAQVLAAWPEVVRQAGSGSIAQAESALGLSLPDDLVSALGDHTSIAFGGMGLAGLPKVALVSDGDRSAADTVAGRSGGFLVVSTTDDTTVLATAGYAGAVIAGGLGDLPAFRAAVPRADSADAVTYVDVPGVLTAAAAAGVIEGRENLDVLQAVGLSATQRGDEGTFTLRATTK